MWLGQVGTIQVPLQTQRRIVAGQLGQGFKILLIIDIYMICVSRTTNVHDEGGVDTWAEKLREKLVLYKSYKPSHFVYKWGL